MQRPASRRIARSGSIDNMQHSGGRTRRVYSGSQRLESGNGNLPRARAVLSAYGRPCVHVAAIIALAGMQRRMANQRVRRVRSTPDLTTPFIIGQQRACV